MQLIGQKENLEIINKWDRLPQFIIITGDENTGKTYLTTYLAEKFGLYYYRMSNDVNSVRNLIELMTSNSNTIYHFKDFQTASLQAKNALLKITEEPLPGNYIIITGSSQLATLESRGRKLVINPYEKQEVIDYGKKYFEDEVMLNNLYLCGINTPAKIFKYRQFEDFNKLIKLVLETFRKITYLNIEDILEIMNNFENMYEDIDECLLFINMLIKFIEYNVCQKQMYSYYDILDILIFNRNELVRTPTLNHKIFLYRTFYEIYELREMNK